MFCIGKLVDYPRNKGKAYYGRIFQISPSGSEFVDFQRSEAYAEGILIRTPSKVKLQSYVAYNLDDITGRPNTVAIIQENVLSGSLYRLIRENKLEGEEINTILQQFCKNEIKKAQTVINAPIELKDTAQAEKEEQNPKVSPDADVRRLIWQPGAFTLESWRTYDDPLKAKMICRAARAKNELRDRFEVSYPEIKDFEKNRLHKIIYALLLFMHSMQVDDIIEKKEIWREAHKVFLTTLSLAYRNEQKAEILPTLEVLLPKCLIDHNVFCDALLQEVWNYDESYITCTQKGYGSVPACMENNKGKFIWEDCTKPHLVKVKSLDEAPDLRDLLYYSKFNVNMIYNAARNMYLDSYDYPYRISAFVIRLNEVWRYLSCRKPGCGEPLFPDFEYKNASEVYTLTKFTCKEYSGDSKAHDYQVYLNHCYACAKEDRGKQIIDSRECVRKKDQEKDTGMWLCMRCGGAQGAKSHLFCPACGSDKIIVQADGSIVCQENDCRLDGSKYGNGPVSIEEIIRFDKFRKNPYLDT